MILFLLPQPPLMEAEELMKLYDSIWFESKIFIKQPSSSISETNPDDQIQEKTSKPAEISKSPKVTLQTRSMSDQLSLKSSLFSSVYLSPDSVLHGTKLHRILSGEEITEENEKQSHKKVNNSYGRRRIKKGSGSTKSLSELEFEELKGFMDLGFVFSEEDYKESSLVSIIPGLQRLTGKKLDEVEERSVDESVISRPYLSEAWEDLDRIKAENPLMNWRVPALRNEIDMKDNLKWWAHTVASTVR